MVVVEVEVVVVEVVVVVVEGVVEVDVAGVGVSELQACAE